MNQPGSKNANCFHRFGENAGINEGGLLTAVAIDDDRVLVSYENLKGQGAGSVAGNGTLFYVTRRAFVSMTSEYDAGLLSKADEKIRVLGLLRRSLELELLNHRRSEV